MAIQPLSAALGTLALPCPDRRKQVSGIFPAQYRSPPGVSTDHGTVAWRRLAVAQQLKVGVGGQRRGAAIDDFMANVDDVGAAMKVSFFTVFTPRAGSLQPHL